MHHSARVTYRIADTSVVSVLYSAVHIYVKIAAIISKGQKQPFLTSPSDNPADKVKGSPGAFGLETSAVFEGFTSRIFWLQVFDASIRLCT